MAPLQSCPRSPRKPRNSSAPFASAELLSSNEPGQRADSLGSAPLPHPDRPRYTPRHDGRVAQWESAAFTRQKSQVRILLRSPREIAGQAGSEDLASRFRPLVPARRAANGQQPRTNRRADRALLAAADPRLWLSPTSRNLYCPRGVAAGALLGSMRPLSSVDGEASSVWISPRSSASRDVREQFGEHRGFGPAWPRILWRSGSPRARTNRADKHGRPSGRSR